MYQCHHGFPDSYLMRASKSDFGVYIHLQVSKGPLRGPPTKAVHYRLTSPGLTSRVHRVDDLKIVPSWGGCFHRAEPMRVLLVQAPVRGRPPNDLVFGLVPHQHEWW